MFLFRFLRLLASITWEGAWNSTCLLASLLPGRKNKMKTRMKTIMCRARDRAVSLVLIGILTAATTLSSGCSSCATHQRPLGADLAETVDLLTEKRPPLEELSKDLHSLFAPEWGEFMDTICRLSR